MGETARRKHRLSGYGSTVAIANAEFELAGNDEEGLVVPTMNVLGRPRMTAIHSRLDQGHRPGRIGGRDLDAHAPARQLDEATFVLAEKRTATCSAHTEIAFEGHRRSSARIASSGNSG